MFLSMFSAAQWHKRMILWVARLHLQISISLASKGPTCFLCRRINSFLSLLQKPSKVSIRHQFCAWFVVWWKVHACSSKQTFKSISKNSFSFFESRNLWASSYKRIHSETSSQTYLSLSNHEAIHRSHSFILKAKTSYFWFPSFWSSNQKAKDMICTDSS